MSVTTLPSESTPVISSRPSPYPLQQMPSASVLDFKFVRCTRLELDGCANQTIRFAVQVAIKACHHLVGSLVAHQIASFIWKGISIEIDISRDGAFIVIVIVIVIAIVIVIVFDLPGETVCLESVGDQDVASLCLGEASVNQANNGTVQIIE